MRNCGYGELILYIIKHKYSIHAYNLIKEKYNVDIFNNEYYFPDFVNMMNENIEIDVAILFPSDFILLATGDLYWMCNRHIEESCSI